jgi:hypothetical protein
VAAGADVVVLVVLLDVVLVVLTLMAVELEDAEALVALADIVDEREEIVLSAPLELGTEEADWDAGVDRALLDLEVDGADAALDVRETAELEIAVEVERRALCSTSRFRPPWLIDSPLYEKVV